MEIVDRGYSFQTFHETDGNVAHVRAHYRRVQTQAPIRRTQKFEMDSSAAARARSWVWWRCRVLRRRRR